MNTSKAVLVQLPKQSTCKSFMFSAGMRWFSIALLVVNVYITSFVAPARNESARNFLESMLEVRRILDRYACVYMHVLFKYLVAVGGLGLFWNPLIFMPWMKFAFIRYWTMHSVGFQLHYCQPQLKEIMKELVTSLKGWVTGQTGYPFTEHLIEQRYETVDMSSWSVDTCYFFRLFSVADPANPVLTQKHTYEDLGEEPGWLENFTRLEYSLNGHFFELLITILGSLVFLHYMLTRKARP